MHKIARDLNFERFPELESIIMNPRDYAKVVLVIGNEQGEANFSGKLSWLSNTEVLSVTMAFAAANTTQLSQDKYMSLQAACKEIIWIEE